MANTVECQFCHAKTWVQRPSPDHEYVMVHKKDGSHEVAIVSRPSRDSWDDRGGGRC